MPAKKRGKARSTRVRLLKAASRVFTRKGYRDATIAEISERAGANIASVNYHFGGKRKLYVAVWHHLFQESLRRVPPDGGVPENAPPEERLRGRIRALIQRITGPDNTFTIMDREFSNPTGLLDSPLKKAIGPLRAKMLALVGELSGKGATARQVEFCAMSIMSQCMALRHVMKMRAHPHAKWLTKTGIEGIVDHVTRFSLGGIREIRSQRRIDR